MPYRLIPRLVRKRLGRRGVVLLLFGVAWAIQAAAVLIFSGEMTHPNPQFWHERVPYPALAGIWGVSGLASMVAAFRHKRSNDTFGFLAVSAPPMMLAVSYGVGIVTHLVLGHWSAMLLGVFGFALWGAVTLALAVIASWAGEDEEVSR